MAAVQYDTVNAIQDAPTFHPTMEEFKDFKKYIESIEPLVKQYGVAKIVPPEEWNQNFNYENVQLTIPHPIKQYVTGTVPGVYEVLLVESPGVAVEEFKEIALGEKVPKSAKYDYDSIERTFWKNIRFNPPMYGADMSGSLFSNDTKYWNLQHLDSILRLLDSHLPGITLPYLYFGMWKAMFAWHVEDMNLASINYLHFGAPKHWYSVPPEHGARFERIMQGYFPEPHKQCPEFLRHKMYMVSPQLLVQKHKIPIYRAVQEKGQFMITYPFAYHCGFNSGFNCAESVNFAMESWLEYGKKANSCKCDSDNVKINIDVLLERLQLFKEGKLDLEKEEQETMERYEATKAQNLVDSPSRRMMGSPKKKSPKKQKLADASALPTGSDEPAISLDGEMEDTSKRKNKVLTSEETNILEAAFVLSDGSIDKNGKETLAAQLNWTPLGVYNWFRRKRRALTGSPPSTTKKETTAKGDPKTDTETRSPTRSPTRTKGHLPTKTKRIRALQPTST